MICLFPYKLHQSSHASMPSTHQMGKDDLGESRWWQSCDTREHMEKEDNRIVDGYLWPWNPGKSMKQHGKAHVSVNSESATPWKPLETIAPVPWRIGTSSCEIWSRRLRKMARQKKQKTGTVRRCYCRLWQWEFDLKQIGTNQIKLWHQQFQAQEHTMMIQASAISPRFLKQQVFLAGYISCFPFGIFALTERAAVVTLHTIGASSRLPEPRAWPRKSTHWTWEPPTDQKPIILTWFTSMAYAET